MISINKALKDVEDKQMIKVRGLDKTKRAGNHTLHWGFGGMKIKIFNVVNVIGHLRYRASTKSRVLMSKHLLALE